MRLQTSSTGLPGEWFSSTLAVDGHGYNNNAEYEKNSKLPMLGDDPSISVHPFNLPIRGFWLPSQMVLYIKYSTYLLAQQIGLAVRLDQLVELVRSLFFPLPSECTK